MTSYVTVFLFPSGPMTDMAPYELIRSRELNAMLGPKGSPQAMDLVCDLHNTTANMGLCLIAYSDSDWICLHIFRHLQVPTHSRLEVQFGGKLIFETHSQLVKH